MKKCVYCGKEFDDEGIYFCDKCKKDIKKIGCVTGNVVSDFIKVLPSTEKADGDLISREKTKAEIRKKFPKLEDRTEINAVINSMPSVQPSGDLISRQAVLDLIEDKFSILDDEYGSIYINKLMKLPTITAEPKKGRWIKNPCIMCANNYCAAHLEGTDCEMQNIFMPDEEPIIAE